MPWTGPEARRPRRPAPPHPQRYLGFVSFALTLGHGEGPGPPGLRRMILLLVTRQRHTVGSRRVQTTDL